MSNAVVNGLAGASGGIIAQLITYPLQTVNTRQQTERVAKKGLSSPPPNHRPAGGTLVQIFQVAPNLLCSIGWRQTLLNFLEGVKEVVKTEGLGGLYSGLKPSLLGTAASQGIYYYFYQVFKNKAERIAAANRNKGHGDGSVGVFSWLLVAALAGSLNVLLTNPIWVLVTRMQTHTQAERKIVEAKRKSLQVGTSESFLVASALQDRLTELETRKPHPYGTTNAACEVYSEAGMAGFWKGIVPTLIMVCNPSIQFMIYESLLKHLRAKRATKQQGSKKNITALEVFLSGAFAKLGATVSTYPLLVVKSRLQAKQDIGGGSVSLRYSGTVDAIVKMIRYEGVSSFYKGMSTKIVQSVFAASVLFLVKEEFVKIYTALALRTHKLLFNPP